jgi:SAM-dependent methyltransferase
VEPFDVVMRYAGQPVRTALEIGAGTGKATRLFAQRGVTVTATEPDEAMLAELRKHVPADVKSVQAAFEDLRSGESYGLVFAAAALHWTNPEGRWPRSRGAARGTRATPAGTVGCGASAVLSTLQCPGRDGQQAPGRQAIHRSGLADDARNRGSTVE